MAEARYKNMWTFLIESNYGDAADIGSDMRCTICTRILINAHNSVCGCRYCLKCVEAYLNGKRRFCPGNTDDCKAEELDIDSNIFPDHTMNCRISKLIVTCRYSCGYRCELRNMEEHEKACQRHQADCSSVIAECRDSRLVTHRINEHLVGENESHASLLVACIDKLESEITSMMTDTVHVRSEMAELRLAREIDEARAKEKKELMNNFDCSKKMIKSMEAKIEIYRLLIFLCLLIICAGVAFYLRSPGDTYQKVLKIQGMVQMYDKKIDRLEHISKKIKQDLLIEKEEVWTNVYDMQEILTTELDNIENRVHNIEIEAREQNQTEFVWIIEGWAEKTKSIIYSKHEVIVSEPFYSHNNGYKMRLSVQLVRYGKGLSTDLGVYLSIMRGTFDNILPWPFKRDVTLSLIDQYTGIDHTSDTIKFQDCPNTRRYNPLIDENEGFDTDTLIEMMKLSSISGLYEDEKVFIRCIVK